MFIWPIQNVTPDLSVKTRTFAFVKTYFTGCKSEYRKINSHFAIFSRKNSCLLTDYNWTGFCRLPAKKFYSSAFCLRISPLRVDPPALCAIVFAYYKVKRAFARYFIWAGLSNWPFSGIICRLLWIKLYWNILICVISALFSGFIFQTALAEPSLICFRMIRKNQPVFGKWNKKKDKTGAYFLLGIESKLQQSKGEIGLLKTISDLFRNA